MNHFDMIIDIACAHSYLGWHRLASALARRRAAGQATTIRFLPAQIRPDAPHNPEPLAVHERELGPQANDDADALARQAGREGLEYRFDRAQFVNTFDAHLLLALAQRQQRQEAATTALFATSVTGWSLPTQRHSEASPDDWVSPTSPRTRTANSSARL